MKPSVRYLLPLLLLFIATSGLLRAQAADAGNFPVTYGPSNLGKEFVFSFPTNYEDPTAAMQYIRLYITSPVRTRVQIYTGSVLKKTVFTVPNDIIQFDLTKFEAQAVSRDNMAPIPPDQVYRRKAVRVVSDEPIVLYGMNRTSFTSDGMLILPVNALGSEYVVASAKDVITGYQGYLLPSQFVVAAAFDGTNLSITSPWQSQGHQAGETYTVQLNKGDVFSSMSIDPGGDLTGANISSNKPIAVTAGQNCTFLPDQRYWACDHIEEMMFPISTWGTLYHSVPFATRLKGDLYRIFASEPETDIYINGVKKFTLSQRGGPEGYGWVEYLPPDRDLIEFSSNKPIMIAQYNNSQQYDNVVSDPFYLVLTPVEQFQKAFVFATPSPGDFMANYMTVVADSAGYDKIEISRTGASEWKKLTQLIPRVVRSFTTKHNGRTFVGVTFDIQAAAYKIRGPLDFTAYVYGFGSYDSYGYPLSAALSDIRSSDKDAPMITKSQDCNGYTVVDVLDMPDDNNIRSNLATVDLLPESYNYSLTVDYFESGVAPGSSYQLTVIDRSKDALAIVEMWDKAGNVTRDTVTYESFKVVAEPAKVAFGEFFTGQSGTRSFTLRNLSVGTVDIVGSSLLEGDVGFTIVDPTGAFTLDSAHKPGATRQMTVRFDATVSGKFLDLIALRDICGNRYVTEVTAEVGNPVIVVSDWDFQTWPVTAPLPLTHTLTISNVTTDPVGTLTVSGVEKNFTDPVIFTLPNGLPAFPLTLRPGQFENLIAAFKPSAVRSYRDSINFTHNAPPNPLNDNIGDVMGRGIQGSLIATSVDWGKRRLGTGPFDSTVTLTNVGTSDVVLTGNVTWSGDQADFQIIDATPISNITLRPNQSVPLGVRFNPTATGQRDAVITYEHNPAQSDPVTSSLRGFGTQPALLTQAYDFGSMDVSSTVDTMLKIRFELPPSMVPDVMDSVTIFDWVLTGDPDFRFDKPVGDVVLKRGREFIELNGYFRAQQVGPRAAQLTARTRDNVDAPSNWIGLGTVKDPKIGGTNVSFGVLCATIDTLEAIITNTGLVDLIITDWQLVNLPASFRLLLTPSQVTLKPGEALPIPIEYTGGGNAVWPGSLVVFSNASDFPTLTLEVIGASVEQDVDAEVVLTADGPNGRTELGKDFLATVRMTEAVNPALPIKIYRVTLTYDTAQSQPVVSKIAVGSANPLATASIASNVPGELVIDVASPNQLGNAGDLISVPFAVMFNSTPNRYISAQVTTIDAACLRFTTVPDSIAVVPICGLSVRLITMNATTYSLSQNSPNPFNPVTKINYSLGLDGLTAIVLRDATGRVVQTLINEQQAPGEYELTLDASDLPSGMYYYTLTSGHWSETRQMMVTK